MSEIFQELKSCHGRFSRSQYWINSIVLSLIPNIGYLLFSNVSSIGLTILLGGLLSLPCIYFQICVNIKRAHDLDKSGAFVWLTVIPLVQLYPFVLFGFVQGTNGPNQYGQDPLTA